MCAFRVGTLIINGAADQSKHGAQESKHHVVNCSSSDKDKLRVIVHFGWKMVFKADHFQLIECEMNCSC